MPEMPEEPIDEQMPDAEVRERLPEEFRKGMELCDRCPSERVCVRGDYAEGYTVTVRTRAKLDFIQYAAEHYEPACHALAAALKEGQMQARERDAVSQERDELELERDKALKENWQLKGALGYPVPADIPVGDWTCGMCNAALKRAEDAETKLRNIPYGAYAKAQREGCDSNGAWEVFCEECGEHCQPTLKVIGGEDTNGGVRQIPSEEWESLHLTDEQATQLRRIKEDIETIRDPDTPIGEASDE